MNTRIVPTNLATELLRLLWRQGCCIDRECVSVTGEKVRVVRQGELEPETGNFTGAQVEIDRVVFHGEVLIGKDARITPDAVLRVVEEPAPSILDFDDRLLPQIELHPDRQTAELFRTLCEGASCCGCGERLAALESVHRVHLYTQLLSERLTDRLHEIRELFETSESDWNQTFYVMLFRAMAGPANKQPYVKLASRVPYTVLSREKESAEALLIGCSGLVEYREPKDDYLIRLLEDAHHLCHKHSIVPLRAAEWTVRGSYPAGRPLVRLAQLAAFLKDHDFLFDNALRCSSPEDVRQLFRAEASDYWRTRRIGKEKADLLGINLVAPIQYAYGDYMDDDRLRARAIDLLERIPAEDNGTVRRWMQKGVPVGSAADSQALMQLSNVYCASVRCGMCPLGRNEIKKSLHRSSDIREKSLLLRG